MFRYKTIRAMAEAEQVIERSRFIAHVCPVGSKEEADAFFAQIREKHRSATHNVPAYVVGEKFEYQWASDDGEPQGTSGAPIAQMMVKEGITNTAVIVTRYFGGIKLGTGGLVRAYTSSARLGLEAGGICQVREMEAIKVSMDYTYWGKIQNLEQSEPFSIEDTGYTDVVKAVLSAEPEEMERVKSLLSNLTGGSCQVLEQSLRLVKAELPQEE